MSDQYAVFGNPIEHSLSPQIHTYFSRQLQQDICYEKHCVPIDAFKDAADHFFSEGGCGLNITVPFKLQAYEYADQLSADAERAGAVNTLKRLNSGEIFGDNTDGRGLVADITRRLAWSLAGRSVLLLGAGGAVRGVLAPLLACTPAKIVIANRTAAKAQALALTFSSLGELEGLGFDEIPYKPFDIIINGTSAGLSGETPPLPAGAVGVQTQCYDMLYGASDTPFIVNMKALGCLQTSDGLGMLVGQAAESFALWRGCKPDVTPVIEHLRQK